MPQPSRHRREPARRDRFRRPAATEAAHADAAVRPAGRPRKRGGCRRAFAIIAALIVLFVVVAGAAAWYLLYEPDTAIAAGSPVHVVIESGSSTARIAEQLSAAGVVENALMFRLKSRLAEADGTLKAGEYDLATGMPYDMVLEALAAGPVIVYFDVPVPEGFTAEQIAARFSERAGIPADELKTLMTTGAGRFSADHPYLSGAYGDSLEGFLFPATYEVREGTSAHDVVEMMLDTFDARIAEIDMSYAESKNLDLRDVVIIASILERESKLPKEFPLVSSVIYNRLKKPMRLQLCATVLYELPEGTTRLKESDLKLDSPYNTYIHDGLPVGPISNPGVAALKAAAQPAKTNYLYYVLTGKDGSQTFTATYADFLRAKEIYKQVYGD
ncbi:MAG: endolytic transglycosylase MltG [Coriobacteriia bacterium]